MWIRILHVLIVMLICNFWSKESPGLPMSLQASTVIVHGPPRLHLSQRKLLNFYIYSGPDLQPYPRLISWRSVRKEIYGYRTEAILLIFIRIFVDKIIAHSGMALARVIRWKCSKFHRRFVTLSAVKDTVHLVVTRFFAKICDICNI